MPKFLKILIVSFLTLVGVALAHFAFAQAKEVVYVCPNATSLEEVNPNCPGKIILKLGETINGMTLSIISYEGQEHYVIYGFVNGGAGVKEEPRLETQIAITEMIYGEIDILDQITQTIGDKKSPLLLSELARAPIDLEDYTLKDQIKPREERKLKMRFKFLETAGNEYQGKSINVKFRFLATQEEH